MSPRCSLLIFSFAAVINSASAKFDPFEGPKPIFVFIESDPWLMAPGSDTPNLVLYEDGELIFRSKMGEKFIYRHQHLDPTAIAAFRQRVKPIEGLERLKPWYNIQPNTSDMSTAKFYLQTDNGSVTTQVYGLFAESTNLPAWTEFHFGPRPDRLPRELRELHKFVTEFDDPQSPEWHPKYVEVMLWDYTWAHTDSVNWPMHWPDLDSERAIKRSGEKCGVFLDAIELPNVEEFFRTQKGFIAVGGRNWSGDYRPTFPSEPLWMKAFHEVPQHVPLTLRDRLDNLIYTAESAFSFFLHFWIPSLALAILALVVGGMRLRAGPITFRNWALLLGPLLIPVLMVVVSAFAEGDSHLDRINAVRVPLLVLLVGFLGIAGTVIVLSRGFRWFTLATALLEAWITLCVLVASLSAIL
jgi:hypothetical protein